MKAAQINRKAAISVASTEEGVKFLTSLISDLQKYGIATWPVEANDPSQANLVLEIIDEGNEEFREPVVEWKEKEPPEELDNEVS